LLLSGGDAVARVPLFPDGSSDVPVARPWASKAFFVRSDLGETVRFNLEPSSRDAPLFLLVVDDGADATTVFEATLRCGDGPPVAFAPDDRLLDEPLSGLTYTIVASATVPAGDVPCTLEVTRTAGDDPRFSLSVGSVTVWLPGDLARVFGWRADLRRWLDGP